MTIDLTREAAGLWRATFALPWPRGWRCLYRPNRRTEAWAWTHFGQRTITLYPHPRYNLLVATLLHEFVHVYTDSHLHSTYFKCILHDVHAKHLAFSPRKLRKASSTRR